jgi:hypothetical protein
MAENLTDAQSHQVDIIHSAAYQSLVDTLSNLVSEENINWDMEWIGEIADCIAGVAERHFGLPEKLVYPYIEEDEDE